MNRKKIILISLCAIANIFVFKGQNVTSKYPSFLDINDLPNAVNYLPAPPDTSSVAFLLDFSQYQWGKSLRKTKRGEQAILDANQSPEALALTFSRPLCIKITKENTPELYKLIELLDTDFGNSTQKAKFFYMRKRPFVQFNEHTSIIEKENKYRNTGSYPSGHSATGWGIALVLSEICPQNQEQILKCGYEIGESRIIAGYHYRSDVDIARLAASATLARLHSDKRFTMQLQKAKEEYRKKSNK